MKKENVKMKLLQDRILKEGRALNKEVLKVDSFLNHAVDPELMYEIGKCFKDNYFSTRCKISNKRLQ